jgi:isoquinoline 1-oxidoreductase alpha subunit
MQAASLLAVTPDPTDAQIDEAMEGNLCRCGTYPRVRTAIKDAAARLKGV